MDYKTLIDSALDAHNKWLIALCSAVESGVGGLKPEVVRGDDSCDFGKWLRASFPEDLKGTPLHQDVMKLHARFHQAAGRILDLVLAGKKHLALQQLESTSPFRKDALALISALTQLKVRL